MGTSSTSNPGGPLHGSDAAVAAMLAESHVLGPHELPALAARHGAAFGARDAVLYLVDLQQQLLCPFRPDGLPVVAGRDDALLIDATMAGRAYQLVQPVVQHRSESDVVLWLPLLDGTERLGVLALVIDGAHVDDTVDDGWIARPRMFASLLAQMVVTKTAYGDSLVRLRRREGMGLAAEMQWSLLPPLTFICAELALAAALEPAYDVAGDTVDYAVDPDVARIALFDGMGHGLRSAQMATMAVTAYRHARRQRLGLVESSAHIDAALLDTFGGAAFTTAVLAELETRTGLLRWVSAGHPEPLLLRNGRLVKSLHARPRPPLGVDLPNARGEETSVGVEQLEPGDVVLLYTDGVVDARTPDGEFFGEKRLADLIVRNLAAGLTPPETIRRVVSALLVHQQGRLTDDATLLMVQWPSDQQAVPAAAAPE